MNFLCDKKLLDRKTKKRKNFDDLFFKFLDGKNKENESLK